MKGIGVVQLRFGKAQICAGEAYLVTAVAKFRKSLAIRSSSKSSNGTAMGGTAMGCNAMAKPGEETRSDGNALHWISSATAWPRIEWPREAN